MIPQKNILVIEGQMPGEEVNFKIGDARWVMDSLASLYSDKEMACIREYSTNARDAHVEAGKNNIPIEITLPSTMNPYFIVEDFGTGMSIDDLRETYTSFGTSTKRTSNAYNGVYGFGSKSAIAYTNQFTIESTKDGFTTHAIVMRKEDRSVVLQIVLSDFTDNPNGTKITIPVTDWRAFAAKARDFYRFWLPGTVLVDDVQPEWSVGEKVDDGLFYSTNNSSYVVMSNVAYRVNNPAALFKNKMMHQFSFVAYAPPGCVEHPPSREDLMYTNKTKETLHDIIDNFETKLLMRAKSEILSQPTHRDAWYIWRSWVIKLGAHEFDGMEYRGSKLFTRIDLSTGTTKKYDIGANGNRKSTYNIHSISLSEMNDTLYVHKFDKIDELGAHHKTVARRYSDLLFNTKKLFAESIVFTSETIDCVWIDPDRIITYENMKAITPRAPSKKRSSNVSGRITGSWDFFSQAGKEIGKLIPEDKKVYYIENASLAKNMDLSWALKLLKEDAIVVIVPQNRLNKFTRDYPAVTRFIDYVSSKINFDGESLLSVDAKKVFKMNHDDEYWLSALEKYNIDDPKLNELRSLHLKKEELLVDYQKNYNLACCIGRRYGFKLADSNRPSSTLFNDYPLMRNISRYNSVNHEHVAIYLNAAYAAKRGEAMMRGEHK